MDHCEGSLKYVLTNTGYKFTLAYVPLVYSTSVCLLAKQTVGPVKAFGLEVASCSRGQFRLGWGL